MRRQEGIIKQPGPTYSATCKYKYAIDKAAGQLHLRPCSIREFNEFTIEPW